MLKLSKSKRIQILQTIGKFTFYKCKQLIKIPSSIERIGEHCFEGSHVEEIYIQSHTSIKFQQNCFRNLFSKD